ncbi:hypothetical protein CONCODRAFT_12354 [Conidiobolus coronatus NRRL 28638]|uniref:Galactose oxidase n=1 Tax=Conidiobolus coronatus (strain ATCC 28846 / CBS 209.66 / NRRL 28638) TaxID=796925 RepID=A0A137NT67_CONC2|nr:hypothetical protein CONCODRAFT_12354 [Conidiobolus coronatus NRRL 28638]|eukprot:KXN65930.1 hypothetical protein CONCODRAFT_12354 [Conidiobolus coronatus NRRL 28638]
MILILCLYIYFVFGDDIINDRIPSGIYNNGKYYVFSPATSDREIAKINIYTLKDGPISQINNTVINITNTPSGYTPRFMNFTINYLDGLSSSIWMLESFVASEVKDNKLDDYRWTAHLVNDKMFNFDSNFIKLPSYTNFPKGGFSNIIVNVNSDPVMYIVGGYTFSSELNSRILTSCVFKYDFIMSSWSDLSEGSKSILPPIANHRSLLVNNALHILNGVSPNVTDTNYPQTYDSKKSIKLNAINKMYRFDLMTEKWTAIPIKTNLDAYIYGDGIMYGASYDQYNGNIISYGFVQSIHKNDSSEPKLGTLDLTNMEWRWNQIKTETGLDNTLSLSYHKTLVVKDQLLIFNGYTNQRKSNGTYVINLKNFKFQSNLDYSGSINSEFGSPIYKYVLIALGITLGVLLLIFAIYILKRRRKKKLRELGNNKQFNAIWASSENVLGVYTTGDRFVDDYRRCEIFSLENNEKLDNQILRFSFMGEDLKQLTLVGTELDAEIKSINSAI